MEIRRRNALRYYHEKIAPFRPLKEPKKVKKETAKKKVRILSIENKKVLICFE